MAKTLLRVNSLAPRLCCSFSASPSVDHYTILGLKPGATGKEIKTAYYKLSKKFHPDTNPDNKDDAAKMFHAVAQAYEVLGSEEQRKLYDMVRVKSNNDFTRQYNSRPGSQNTKQYTDIDIDYKTFEQFQRSTRRRRQFHSHFEMPKEFYAEFGGRRRVYKSEFDEATAAASAMYTDSRAQKREQEELEREIQREKERMQAKYPIPTFEKLIQEKRAKEQAEQRKYLLGMLGCASGGMLLFLLAKN